MSSSRRVVVTGIGVVSPLGLHRAALSESLRTRRSGVGRIRAFDPSGLPVQIASEVIDFDARNYLEKKDRKSLKMMARTVQLAVGASRMAIQDAELSPREFDPTRFGVVFGSSTLQGELIDLAPGAVASFDPATNGIDLKRWGAGGMSGIQPMFMLNHVPNMTTCHVSILTNAQGPNNTITQSDVAGLLALGEARNVLQRDAADLTLAGGADTRTPIIGMIRYALFNQLSHCQDPERACRPFDRDRDGMVMGEGATVFLLEELDHARRRSARIIAEMVGFASGFDPGRSGTGLARVIRLALAEAGIEPADLDHINAHAPGTTADDVWEARGIAQVLGNTVVPVVACKSQLGNLGAAGSVTELAGSLIGLDEGWRPGTINHEHTDPDCPVHVAREPGAIRHPYVLKISGTEMGQCAALVVRRWD